LGTAKFLARPCRFRGSGRLGDKLSYFKSTRHSISVGAQLSVLQLSHPGSNDINNIANSSSVSNWRMAT